MIASNDINNNRGGSLHSTTAHATQQDTQSTIRLTALQRLEIAQTEWKKVLNPNATPGVPVVN